MISEERQRVLELFKEGRKLYTLRKFAEAREVFTAAIGIDKEDGPSQVFRARCKHYLENPPPPDWDGVWKFETK